MPAPDAQPMPDATPPPLPTGLTALPPAWQAVLGWLKRQGEATAEMLAEHLGITASGMRQHLAAMGRDGLVQHREQRGGPGRPKHMYAMTPAADGLFPRGYAELTNELLAYAEAEDDALVARLFERRSERRLAAAQLRIAGLPFAAQVATIAQILDEDGYLASLEDGPNGTFRLVEHNCMVLGVAKKFPHACASELAFLRAAMPGATVQRVSHMLAGAHVCAYEVVPGA